MLTEKNALVKNLIYLAVPISDRQVLFSKAVGHPPQLSVQRKMDSAGGGRGGHASGEGGGQGGEEEGRGVQEEGGAGGVEFGGLGGGHHGGLLALEESNPDFGSGPLRRTNFSPGKENKKKLEQKFRKRKNCLFQPI